MNTSVAASRGPVPSVDFYGDEETWPTSERLHSEPLVERSAEYDWTIRAHRHDRLTQIFLLLQGGGIARLDSVAQEIDAPAVLVVPERCVHEFEWSSASTGFVLSITSSLIARLQRKLGPRAGVLTKPGVLPLPGNGIDLGAIFRRVHEEYVGDAPLRDLMLESCLIEMSVALARLTGDEPDADRQPGRGGGHYRRFVELVEDHHKDHWNVARYADALGISAPYLNALCKRHAGRSAKRLVNDRLLLAARRGLAYTDNSITTVSRHLGFADPSYFTRFFRRAEGATPSQFRRRTGTLSATGLDETPG